MGGHNWHTFDSKSEAQRYIVLRLREKLRLIRNLQIQVKFELETTTYKCDFFYFEVALWWKFWTRGVWVVEDWKNGHFSERFEKVWKEMQGMRKYKKYKFVISEELLG